jgi:isocitrate/isopropylmalate dehydrogenase
VQKLQNEYQNGWSIYVFYCLYFEFVAAGLKFEITEKDVGGAAIDAAGVPLPDDTLTACQQADAVLLAAIGG